MTPLPKRKHSTRRKGKRLAARKINLGASQKCKQCGKPKLSHNKCRHCGAR